MPIGMSFCGFLAFLRGGRDRVEADVGEEDRSRPHHDAADPEIPEGAGVVRNEWRVVGAIDEAPADTDEDQYHRQLDDHDHRIGAGGLLDADHQEHGDQEHDDHRRNVGDPLHQAAVGKLDGFEWTRDQLSRQGDAERVQEGDYVCGPTDRNGGGADGVFEHKVPADDPGDPFAERRVGIGVGAARHRDHAGELAVAQAGEQAAKGRDHHRECHGGAGILRRGDPRQREQAGADDRADAQGDQVTRPQRSLQVVLAAFGFGKNSIQRFRSEKAHTVAFLLSKLCAAEHDPANNCRGVGEQYGKDSIIRGGAGTAGQDAASCRHSSIRRRSD